MTTTLASKRHVVADLGQAMDLCYERGWTDGLPVVPPTEAAVQRMLDAAGLAADAQLAFITNRQVAVTAEKVAINAVMAGCLPEYMPVVVAAVEAISDPLWAYHGPATSTGGAGPLVIVNGPIARRLEINCEDNLFGPGWRANATIGRAVRLVMRNVIGTLPGLLDRECQDGRHPDGDRRLPRRQQPPPGPPRRPALAEMQQSRGERHSAGVMVSDGSLRSAGPGQRSARGRGARL